MTTAPDFSVSSLLDGKLASEISSMCADQFPARSYFVRTKACMELLLGKQQNNGILAAHEGYLISLPKTTEQQLSNARNNLNAVARFSGAMAQRDIPFVFAPVPRSIDVNKSKLPRLYSATDADEDCRYLSQCALSLGLAPHDLTTPLRVAADGGQEVWYRTDHHWTSLGAYYAYLSLADALGYTPFPISDFEPSVVCTDFLGTAHAASGMSWVKGEPISLFRYPGDDRLQTEILQNGQVKTHLDGLYDFAALRTHDEYNVFLGGTNTHIRVSDPQRPDAPTLLLLKDSFSQSLSPFLARHYNLILIDPRTYSTQSEAIFSLVERADVDAVLLLYGVDTLFDSYSLRVLEYGLG
ncbi:MAG: hypothetical protein E7625_00325 [Ruminococcaceae bacterium]|nr:hypothetical protein [Oscillospiraceae bacterium]